MSAFFRRYTIRVHKITELNLIKWLRSWFQIRKHLHLLYCALEEYNFRPNTLGTCTIKQMRTEDIIELNESSVCGQSDPPVVASSACVLAFLCWDLMLCTELHKANISYGNFLLWPRARNKDCARLTNTHTQTHADQKMSAGMCRKLRSYLYMCAV